MPPANKNDKCMFSFKLNSSTNVYFTVTQEMVELTRPIAFKQPWDSAFVGDKAFHQWRAINPFYTGNTLFVPYDFCLLVSTSNLQAYDGVKVIEGVMV